MPWLPPSSSGYLFQRMGWEGEKVESIYKSPGVGIQLYFGESCVELGIRHPEWLPELDCLGLRET